MSVADLEYFLEQQLLPGDKEAVTAIKYICLGMVS
jgi:hypothetical protein